MTFEKLKKIIVSELGVEESEVKLETTFEELGADSLDLTQIVVEVEDEFDIQVEETDEFKTVGDVVKYIDSKLA